MAEPPGRDGLDSGEIRRLRASWLRNDVRRSVERLGAMSVCCCGGTATVMAAPVSQAVDDQARALLRHALAEITDAADTTAAQRRAARRCAERLTGMPREDWLPAGLRMVCDVRETQDGGMHPELGA
jgi:hypothetical protein